MDRKVVAEIVGEIATSDDVGLSLRKWRELFGVSQKELADYLGVSVSTVSDYEANRRKNPGVQTLRKFVEALIELDVKRGGEITKKLLNYEVDEESYFAVHEFTRPISLEEFANVVRGVFVFKGESERKVYGYTLIDSLRVILEMPNTFFYQIYGRTSERALIFTGVSTGRSPMVAVRISSLKPALVVLHGLKEVDKLAVKIAEKENIPLLLTDLDISLLSEKLNRL